MRSSAVMARSALAAGQFGRSSSGGNETNAHRSGRLQNKDRLRDAIEAFNRNHIERANLFGWRKREVKGFDRLAKEFGFVGKSILKSLVTPLAANARRRAVLLQMVYLVGLRLSRRPSQQMVNLFGPRARSIPIRNRTKSTEMPGHPSNFVPVCPRFGPSTAALSNLNRQINRNRRDGY
jgi:hypothetical protein